MDLEFLDQQSKVKPLLMRLYESRRLLGLGQDKKDVLKTELSDAIFELLDVRLSSREQELVADVMIALLRQAEQDFRQALAVRLAAMENVPLPLVVHLAKDEIDIARPILERSLVLSDLDLMEIIKSKSSEYWQAIARRHLLSHQVMNALADTGDFDTAMALAQNEYIILNEYVLGVLASMAQGSEDLAQPLLRRDEVDEGLARELYAYVSEELKFYLQNNFGIEDTSVVEAVDDVLLEFVDSTRYEREFSPTLAMIKDAQRYKEKGLLTLKTILGTLRRGQIKPFVAQFSTYTGLSSDDLLDILNQPSGQGLAVACKAFDISKEDFIAMYLLTNRCVRTGRWLS